jgi:acetoacetate decarboxylase
MSYVIDRSDVLRLARAPVFTADFAGAEMLVVVFRTDPSFVADVLPRPLRPTGTPLATAFVARYPSTNFGDPYNEGALFVHAEHRGETGLYCLAMPVDDDMAMVGGREHFGFPKKMADEITLERDGGHAVGRVVRKGAEVLRIEAELADDIDPFDLPIGEAAIGPDGQPCLKLVSYLFKHFPAADGGLFETPPLLVRQVTLLRPLADPVVGAGKLVLTSSPTDSLGDVPVRDIVSTFYGTFDSTMLPGRVVRRIRNPLRFARHAMFKSDILAWTDPATVPQAGWAARRRRRRQLSAY